MRDSHHQINKPGHNSVCCFSHCCRNNSQDKCHNCTECSSTDSDNNADRKPSDCSGKHISSKPVCSERITQTGWQILSGKVCCLCRFLTEKSTDTDSCQKTYCYNQENYGCLSSVPSLFSTFFFISSVFNETLFRIYI